MEVFLFWIFAIIIFISALVVILAKNPITSALALIVTFFILAGYYVVLSAQFLAAVQVVVYAGAIMVLFLFVIMLLGTRKLKEKGEHLWQRRLAIGLGFVLLAEVAALFLARDHGLIGMVGKEFGSPAGIGIELFRNYLLPFEITSILLLVGMIGAIVLTKDD